MIFTTASIPYRAVPSELFKLNGDTNGYPGSVGSSPTFALPRSFQLGWEMFKAALPKSIRTSLLGPEASNDASILNVPIPHYFPIPPVGISFDKPSEETVNTVKQAGMVEDTHGRRRYFKGVLTLLQLGQIARLAPDDNTFVPPGIADLKGLKAYIIAYRIIMSALKCIPSPATGTSYPIVFSSEEDDTMEQDDADKPKRELAYEHTSDIKEHGDYWPYGACDDDEAYIMSQDHYIPIAVNASCPFIVDSAEGLPAVGGHFLPFFTGMTLPDTTFVPDFISRFFSSLLVTSEDESHNNARTLRSGWGTASSTVSGLVLSHIAFCLQLALTGGGKPYLLMQNSVYAGTIILGEHMDIVSKGNVHKPLSVEKLHEEIGQYDSHDKALKRIAKIINKAKIEPRSGFEEGSHLEVTADLLSTPRLIHNILRNLILTNEEMKSLRAAFARTKFQTNFWDPKSPQAIMKFITAVGTKEYLSDEEPISIMSDAMFTKEVDLSTIAAFGAIAPSITDPTGTAIPIMRKPKKKEGDADRGVDYLLTDRKVGSKPALPRQEFPLFLRKTPTALSDWRHMMMSKSVAYKISPRGGAQGTAMTVPKKESKQIAELLVAYYAPEKKTKSQEKKRKNRDIEDLTPKEIKDIGERKAKKAKLAETAGGIFGEEPLSSFTF